MTHADRRRSHGVRSIALALAVAVVAGIGIWAWSQRDGDEARTVSIVNNDAGVDGTKAGDQVADLLRQSDEFRWDVVDSGSAGDHFATVTIPEDFTAAIRSLTTPDPRQAVLTVTYNGGSAGDQSAMERLVTEVSDQTGAAGVKDYLTNVASARQKLQQASMVASLLSTGVAAADEQAQGVLSGTDAILPQLQTARAGADQLVDVAGQVSGLVSGAGGSVDSLADRLTQLGLTVGDIESGSAQARAGIDRVTGVIEASGVPADDVLADLRQTRSDLQLASDQMSALTGLLGAGSDTELGPALRSGFGQLQDVSAQLSEAGNLLQSGIGPIADQAPELLGATKDQIVAAVTQLKNVSKNLSDQLGQGIGTLPTGDSATVSTVLSAPITVVDENTPAGAPLLSSRNLAVTFGVTTALLAVALVWALRTRSAR